MHGIILHSMYSGIAVMPVFCHCGNYIVEVTMHLSCHDLLAAVSCEYTAIAHDQQMHPITII